MFSLLFFFTHPFIQAVGPLYKLYRTSLDDEATWKSTLQTLEDAISVFEVELAKRGTVFFGGSLFIVPFLILKIQLFLLLNYQCVFTGAKAGMLDYMIWPFFERYPSLNVLSNGRYKVNMGKFPKLVSKKD